MAIFCITAFPAILTPSLGSKPYAMRTPEPMMCKSSSEALLIFRRQAAGFGFSPHLRPVSSVQSVVAKLQDERQQEVGAAGIAAIAGGFIAIPVVAWSLYTLKTTGCGLPPGPAGAIGALEGVSYLVVLGLIGWSIYTKVKTGSGLPSGPFGLLGAVEGLSFLTVLGIAVVFGLQYLDYGFIPGPVPGEQCFG